jgi:OOP family OmpA-OmpF porin
MNLFAHLTSVLNSEVLSRIAAYIDEPIEKTNKAVNGLVYTIVGGLMKRTTSEIGVNQLYNHIQKGRYDGTSLDSLATALRDPALTNTLITQGNDVISHLLPAMKSSIGSMISSYAGIRNSSAISLLGLTTTIVLQVLGKQVKDQKLDADGLAATLFSEREALVNLVPEEFMPRLIEKVGLHQVIAGLAAPARRTVAESPGRSAPAAIRPTATYDQNDESDSDSGALTKWGVGALIAVALAFGGYYLYQNTQKYSNGDEATEISSVANDTIQTDTVTRSLAVPKEQVTKTAPGSTSTSAAASMTTLSGTATAGSLTQQLTPYLGNPALPKGRAFPLTGVAFQPGSLAMTPGSQATVNELATLLKTYPQMQVLLIGFANDAQGGFTNKNLSFKRVSTIKQQLVSSGINFMRIDAVGRGTGQERHITCS